MPCRQLHTATFLRLLTACVLVWASDTEAAEDSVSENSDSLQIAEIVLLHQRDTGGWPKNYDRKQQLSDEARVILIKAKSNVDSTIDNGATHTEIRLLANAYQETRDQRFAKAALRGIEYLLQAQYANGGWPQYSPQPKGYAKHITFNDNAMIGVMRLLRDIAQQDKHFSFVSPSVCHKCEEAVAKGIECVLRCQIEVEGELAVWCSQHDEHTFEPRKARSYELPSLSGSESVGIARFLMDVESPSKEIVRSIEAAAKWFERSKLDGVTVVRVEDRTLTKGYDRVVVADPDAPPMWARFYDINTNKPIFCSRDGVPRATLAEISYERRNGYSWLGHYADAFLTDELPTWRERTEARNIDE